ncbi:MAG: DUF1934 domain-containing protein [Acetatifactor sp.]|nr:DUF1934 domain-containing protein [Acetatifactor sp.]
MNKDVNILIIGRQKDAEGEESKISTKVRGEYYERNNSIYLLYDEQDPDNGAVTKNTLKLTGSVIVHTKKGATESQMTFESDTLSTTRYTTPFGVFLLEIRTRSVTVLMGEDAGTLIIQYELYNDGVFLSENRLTIKIKSISESS